MRPIQTRFPFAFPIRLSLPQTSKSLTHYTKGTQSPFTGFHCLYIYGFRFYFTPLSGVLFAFPSRYWFTIGQSGVFSLGGWSPHVQTGFHVPRLTHFSSCMPFRLPGYHRLWPAFPDRSTKTCTTFGLLRVRSSLLAESRLISVPPGTEIFQFPGFASLPYRFKVEILSCESGFPHSDIAGSMLVASSPALFAGCHVLLRL